MSQDESKVDHTPHFRAGDGMMVSSLWWSSLSGCPHPKEISGTNQL